MKLAQIFILAAAPCLLLATVATAQATTVNVTAIDNIDAAGLSSAAGVDPSGSGGGTLPLQINVTGSLYQFQYLSGGCNSDTNFSGYTYTDGNGLVGTGENVNSYGSISAYKTSNAFSLIGVFLGPGGQTGPAPSPIDFTTTTGIGMNFTSLSPQIGQIFEIGDGYTSSDITRTYYVPTGATELYLGFADAPGFNGDCGHFNDNGGSVNINVTAAPEPGPVTLLLAGSALMGLVWFRNKRQARNLLG